MLFTKATKRQAKLRLALIGPSGSGKTYSALAVATQLGERVALIDTEHGSASKYADIFTFDACELPSHHPKRYIEAIKAAAQAGYDVLIIDSLSHAWSGKDGALELKDKAAKASKSGNSFTAWADITPLHNELIDTILGAPVHIIATMRSKTEYVLEENDRGKKEPKKVGTAAIQREGVDYEFDVVGEMTSDNTLIITKTRCPQLHGVATSQPGRELADTLRTWLTSGAPDLSLLVSQLRTEYARVRKLGGDVPPLTPERVASMSQLDLEAAINELREQAAELSEREGVPARLAGVGRS
ncbi:MAG: ATP-binding protein [Chloroflexota bacterium]|nr:ATP-binding protein [Chloroflexota bacterium]